MAIRLSRMGMINWHYINTWQVCDFGNVTTITGNNTAGKSTLLDALQSCLCAKTREYNRANSLTSKEFERTLVTYMRGRIDLKTAEDDKRNNIRNGPVTTYIVCELHYNMTGRFTLIGFTAHLSNESKKCDDKKWWYIQDTRLCEFEPVAEIGDKKAIRPLKEMMQEFPQMKVFERVGEVRREFSVLFGFTQNRTGNDVLFDLWVKSVTQTIAYNPKEIKNTDQLLRTYLFEQKEVDAEALLSHIDVLIGYREELAEIQAKIGYLQDIKNLSDSYDQTSHNMDLNRIAGVIAHNTDELNRLEETRTKIHALQSDLTRLQDMKTYLQDRLESVNKQKMAMENGTGLELLENDIKYKERELEEIRRKEDQIRLFRNEIDRLSSITYVKEALDNSFPEMLCDWNKTLDELSEQIMKDFNTLDRERASAYQTKSELTREKDELIANNPMAGRQYEKYIDCMKAMKEHFADSSIPCRPEYLFNLLQCKDDTWLPAIESMLGNQRYDIVVPGKYYTDAAAFLKKYCKTHDYYGVSVIDLRGITEPEVIRMESAAKIMHGTQDDVSAYIHWLLKNVILSDDAAKETFEAGSRFIDKDLMLYTGRRLSRMRPVMPLIGRMGEEARKARLHQLSEMINDFCVQIQDMASRIKTLQELRKDINSVKTCVPREEDINMVYRLNACEQELNELYQKRDEIRKSIDVKTLARLEAEIANLKKQEFETEKEKDIVIAEKTKFEMQAEELEKTSDESSKRLQELEGSTLYPEADRLVTQKRAEYKRKSLRAIADDLTSAGEAFAKDLDETDKKLQQKEREYENYYGGYGSEGRSSVHGYIAKLAELSDKDYPKHQKMIDDIIIAAKEALNRDVIASLRDGIRRARSLIRELNSVLRETDYNGRIFAIDPIKPAEGFEEHYRAIMQYTGKGENFDLFADNTNAPTEEEYTATINAIIDGIKAYKAGETSVNWLDYRTYCKFGISAYSKGNEQGADPLEASIAPGSGSQVQIPFYMIFASALLRVYNAASKHSVNESGALRIMMIDEAFDKLDKENITKIMHTLASKMGIQLVLVAPSQRMEEFQSNVDAVILMETNITARNRCCFSFTWDEFTEKVNAGDDDDDA